MEHENSGSAPAHIGSDVDSRATIMAMHLDIEPGASSKVTSLSFVHGDGISAGGDIGGSELRWLRLRGANLLSSSGDATLGKAPRSSNPTSTQPPTR